MLLLCEKVVNVTTGQAFLVAACGQVKKRVKKLTEREKVAGKFISLSTGFSAGG